MTKIVWIAVVGLSACVGSGGSQMSATVDGRPLPLWTMGEMPDNATIYAPTDSAEVAHFGRTRTGQTVFYLPASSTPRTWDYRFFIVAKYDADPSPETPLSDIAASQLSSLELEHRIEQRISETTVRGWSYSSDFGQASFAIDTLTPRDGGGAQMTGRYDGTLCLSPSDTRDGRPTPECVEVTGVIDANLADWR